MGNNVYFISDLHLGAGYLTPELKRQREQRVVDFLDAIASDAAELILVGDILDYWYEYRTVVPRGYVRFFGALARLADRGVKITWFIGNHDIWLFDYLRDEIGLRVVDGVECRQILGKNFLITHGDGVGRYGFGFRFIRAMFRNRLCQKLYAGIHPRWTIPFANNWSDHSRKKGGYAPDFPDPRNGALYRFAAEYAAAHPGEIDYFVFGHEHKPVDIEVGDTGARMIGLGDWIRNFTYGRFDGHTFELLRWEVDK